VAEKRLLTEQISYYKTVVYIDIALKSIYAISGKKVRQASASVSR